jgi:hypothetical protein
MERCPIHNILKFGFPLRCLICEPDTDEAIAERKKMTSEDIDNMTDADVERFERVLARTYAAHSALTN